MEREQLTEIAQLQVDVARLKEYMKGSSVPQFTKRFYWWLAFMNAVVIGIIICLHFIVSNIDKSLIKIVGILSEYEAVNISDVPTQ